MINAAIGNYTIIEELGRGGMAVVYRAHDRSLEREVAVKVLPREFLHDQTFRERFTREAQTIGRLEHPTIVPVYDFGEDDGQPFFVMRYMKGGSLADRIVGEPLPLEDIGQIIDRIGAALDAAHARAIIHRDVKPGNILFDDANRAYLSDFGIVRLTESTAHLTGSGIVSTPAYMAPELAEKGGLTSLVDVYSLGVTLFEMLTGYQPYQADTPMGLIMAHATATVPDIREICPDLPEEMQSVVSQSLAKDPAERYQSAGELAEGLRKALGRSSISVPTADHVSSHRVEPDEVEATLPEPFDESMMLEVEPTLLEVEPTAEPTVLAESTRKQKPWVWLIVAGMGGLITLIGLILAIAAIAGVFTRTTEPEEDVELVAEASTDTPEPTDEPTEIPTATVTLQPTNIPLPPGFEPVTRNDDWIPVVEVITGAEMALVPAGCFDMGSTDDEVDYVMQLCEAEHGVGACNRDLFIDEKPQHQVCFEEPFWIDVYEVTNKQYGSSGNWPGDNLPRDEVSWDNAAAHCEARGARLPTEAEWEYAARGPDSLIYPWGDAFNGTLLNYCDTNCTLVWAVNSIDDGYKYTAPVGSYPRGVSWVGAYDLSGNVWEWVNDWYDENYYYQLEDGAVNPQGPAVGEYRALKGGSWSNFMDFVRPANRVAWVPDGSNQDYGFRCALTCDPDE